MHNKPVNYAPLAPDAATLRWLLGRYGLAMKHKFLSTLILLIIVPSYGIAENVSLFGEKKSDILAMKQLELECYHGAGIVVVKADYANQSLPFIVAPESDVEMGFIGCGEDAVFGSVTYSISEEKYNFLLEQYQRTYGAPKLDEHKVSRYWVLNEMKLRLIKVASGEFALSIENEEINHNKASKKDAQ